MKTMKFRTNAKCGGCVSAIGEKLNGIINKDQWDIDLSSPDRTLTVTADIAPEVITDAVKEVGFNAEQL